MVGKSSSSHSTSLEGYDNGSQLETMQDCGVHSNLFITSDISDKDVELNVMDPILNNLFDKSKAAFIRFHTTKRVNNPILYERYECYREKLKSEGKNPQETYGFIQLPNGDKGEDEELCAYGVRVGMHYRGELADASKGVYMSRYSDTCTPSPFINDQCLRILICKVLLGRSRKVLPSASKTSWTTPPDPTYNSYVSLIPDVVSPGTSNFHSRYLNSLIYIYEYSDNGNTADRPASIFPLSVVEVQCNKPGADFLNVLVPRNCNSTVWTGVLHIQRYILKHVTMHSHFVNVGRPRGLDIFQFKVTVPYDTVANCLPIMRLLQDDMIGILLQRSEVTLNDQQTPMHIQYFIVKCDECPIFDGLCTLMRKFELVAVNRLSSKTHLFLIPNGGLSMKLGLCMFNTASFHCISVSTRSSNQANINWQADTLVMSETPPKRSIISLKTIAARSRQIGLPVLLKPALPNVVPPVFMDFSVPPPNIRARFAPSSSTFPKMPLHSFSTKTFNVVTPQVQQVSIVPPIQKNPGIRPILPEQGKPTIKNPLDPRLSNKGKDPRRPLVVSSSSRSTSNEVIEIDEQEDDNNVPKNNDVSTSQNSRNKSLTQQDLKMLLHGARWFDPSTKKTNEQSPTRRRRSPSSGEDNLEIIEEFVPVAKSSDGPPRKRRTSFNIEEGEDIDLRPQNSSSLNGHRPKQSKVSRLSELQVPGIDQPNDATTISVQRSLSQPLSSGPSKQDTPGPSSSTCTTNKLVIIVDPDLIILSDFFRAYERLRGIFFRVRRGAGQQNVSFKWHSCIMSELRKQMNDAPQNTLLSTKVRNISSLLKEFENCIEFLPQHHCDIGVRAVRKSLICSLSIKRANENERIVFLSDTVNQKSAMGPNFTDENIELHTPDSLILTL